MEVNLNIGSHLFRLDTKSVLMVSKKYEVETTSDDFDEELEVDVLHIISFNILFYSRIQLKFYQEIPKDSIMLHNKTIDLLYNDILSIMDDIPINTKEYPDVRLTIQEV